MSPQGSTLAGEEPTARWRVVATLTFLLLPLLLTLVLYHSTLSQPFFWDDVPHFEFATSRTLSQIWGDVRGLSYYRPLTFTLYKAFFELLPPSTTTLPHLFLLLIHTANGWLVGILAGQLLARKEHQAENASWLWGLTQVDVARLLAALLFVSYPFAVLPVSHFAAMMHPLVTLFALGAALSALRFTVAGQRCWLVAAAALALAASFTHESGIMAGPLAAAVVALYDWGLLRRRWKGLLLLPCASALFLLAWLMVPRTPTTFQWTGWGGMLASLTFFAQGASFPLQPLSRLAMDRLAGSDLGIPPMISGLPWWDLAAIWAVTLTALLLAGLVLWRARRLKILAIVLAWSLLMALPSIVMLPFPYVSVSQRLLYSSGPAAALLWSAVCVSIAPWVRQPAGRAAAAVALAALVAAVPVVYIQREMALHQMALEPLAQLAAAGREHPGERHLVLNPLNWLNYRQPRYALGQEGVSVAADYVDLNRLVRLNSGSDARFDAATFPDIKVEMAEHYYSTIGEEAPWGWNEMAKQAYRYDQIWLTSYTSEKIESVPAGEVRQEANPMPTHYLASFEDRIFLLDAKLEVRDQVAFATLEWQYQAGIPEATIFRHVTDLNGNLLAQGDGFALGRTLRFELLAPGTALRDVRHIPLEVADQDGRYTLLVGLYLPDGSRVPARARDGTVLEDGQVIVPGEASDSENF